MSGERLLLVDDSKTQLVALQMVFKKEGYELLTASDGLEGVSKAFAEKPDIIISDILMPELNGYQLCRLLKSDMQTSHIPIILRTSLDQKKDEFWGIRAGADRYIVKGSDFSGLKDAVRALLKESARRSNSSAASRQTSPKNMDMYSIKTSLNQLLDKLLFESTLSSEAKRLTNFINDRDGLLKETVGLINSLVNYSCFCICLFSSKQTRLFFDLKEPVAEKEIDKVRDHLMENYFEGGRKNKKIETHFIKESGKTDNSSPEKMNNSLTVPMNIHDECIGYLSFHSKNQAALTPESENIIRMLVPDLSAVFQLLILYEETKELSITDGLTNLYNKHYFLNYFEKEFSRAKRFKHKLSLIITDIDHFKAVNDNYGHLQGDSILKEVGAILKHNVRASDFPARYGGEEFVIIAPNTDIQGTGLLAEKIRSVVETHRFKGEKEPMKITVSLGVATLNGDTGDKLELVKMADDALYKAKDTGRNRVCLAK